MFHDAGDVSLIFGQAADGNRSASACASREVLLRLRELLPPVRRRPDQAAQPDLGRRDAGPGLPGQASTRPTTSRLHAAGQHRPCRSPCRTRLIDVSPGGPYANYNWELLYHIPVMVAVHLCNNQRFAEAQKWFHLVFDPTSTDTTVPAARAVLEVLRVPRRPERSRTSTRCSPCSAPRTPAHPAQIQAKADVITSYNAILPTRSSRTSSPAPAPARTSGTS